MSRNIDDISIGDFAFPDAGKYSCKCLKAEKIIAKTGNSGIELTWMTTDGGSQFRDTLWFSPKAIGRLALVAKRLCVGARDLVLDDDDKEAMYQLGDYIIEHIADVYAIVEIAEFSETFIHESGDKIGQKETIKKKKVAFSGYEAMEDDPNCPF